MADALVSNVIRQLAVIRKDMCMKKDVDDLSRSFTKIHAVLKDVEEKKIKDSQVRRWLQELKDVTYDADDMLDEWNTEILKSQIEGVDDVRISLTKKVCPVNLISPCFCFKPIGLHHVIGDRIKEIKARLNHIASEKDKFSFIETTRNEIKDEPRRRIETSSLVDVPEVFGRDEDKKIIISKLLSEGSHQEVVFGVPLISIVGMRGMGKTTLAQLAFNDYEVKKYFNKRIWVHVSKPFDKVKVAMHIIKEIDGNINTQGRDDIGWEVVCHQLTNSIYKKHFLLVLDDVWIEDPMEWDLFRFSLKCGSQGSGIIVTTRNERVVTMMGTTYVHRLGVLSNETCWSLLRQYAFVGKQEEDSEKATVMQLAKMCNGYPLSAKILGSLLRFKKSKEDRENVMRSDVWKGVSSFDIPILPALLLSYNDLPSHLKQCLAYCSLIPKIYRIDKWSMIRQWMAQGFLSDRLAVSDTDWDTIGDEYFNNLVMRAFLKKDIKYSRGGMESYAMHDLVHDLAKSLVENESFTLSIKDNNAEELINFSGARHLYLLTEETSTIPTFIYKAKNLRTLKIYGQIPLVSPELFHHLTCLRTLDLGFTYLEEVPKEIEKLIHLRFLNLAGARFKELPKTMTSLYNLQVLYLANCGNLCKLPEGFGRFINLVDLDLTECCQLGYLPEGIGRLSNLRHLSDFIIEERGSGICKIGELKGLNFLRGSLQIIGLGKLTDGNEAKMACLEKKQDLRALYFYFHQYTGVSLVDEDIEEEEEVKAGEEEVKAGEEEEEEEVEAGEEEEAEEAAAAIEEIEDMLLSRRLKDEEAAAAIAVIEMLLSKRLVDVLEGLKPHENLEKLIISDYLGAVFPNWKSDYDTGFNIFSNLVFLELSRCRKCKQLPTLGKLPSLHTLVIDEMDEVEVIGAEFFTIDGATRLKGGDDKIFPKLKVFQLSRMWNLKKWDARLQKDNRWKKSIFMPSLQYLFLGALPKLRLFPRNLTRATSLRKLFIWDCPKLTLMLSPSSNLEKLILKNDAGSFSKSLVPNNQMVLLKLRKLCVRQSPYSSLPEGLGKLKSLQILAIESSSNIKSIPEGELQHLTAIQELTIMGCPALGQRCQKEIGEDWIKISHIPKIFIDGKKIK